MPDVNTAFLADILEHPDDDTPRLVYADWLEDHGEPQRAEFIRVQCELVARPGCGCGGSIRHCASCRLRRRERELWRQLDGADWTWDRLPNVLQTVVTIEQENIVGWPKDAALLTFRRGFVEAVTLTAEAWVGRECGRCGGSGQRAGADRPFEYIPNAIAALRCPDCHGTGRVGAHGPALVRAAPLTSVRLSDREPMFIWEQDGYWRWLEELVEASPAAGEYIRHDLPTCLYGRLRAKSRQGGWPTKRAAEAAASVAYLAWARDLRHNLQI